MNDYLWYLIVGIGVTISGLIGLIIVLTVYFICFTFIENQIFSWGEKISFKTRRKISLVGDILLWILLISVIVLLFMLMGYVALNGDKV